MRRLTLLILLLAVCTFAGSAQNTQALIEAYRNGTLTQSQIDELRNQQQGASNNSNNLRRNRQVNTTAGSNSVRATAPQSPFDDSATKRLQRTVLADQMAVSHSQGQMLQGDIIAGDTVWMDSTYYFIPYANQPSSRIYGHDMFLNGQSSFEPNLSIATPDNYVLGPGDEVILDVWGNSQMTAETLVTPDGKIHIPNVGPVTVAGLTISEATKRLRSSLGAIYEGLYDGTVQMKLSLGSIRSIQVNVMGEVNTPGTYTVPSLATLFHALYMAGGVSDLGTMRSIKLYRDGKLLSEVDLYEYILGGKSSGDVALRDGDIISVSAYGKLVEFTGEVKRPMFYELRDGETISDLIDYAGGFTAQANSNIVSVTRRQGGRYNSFTVDGDRFDEFVLEDGDVVSVAGSIDRYENRVEVQGAVYREGFYAIDDNVRTLKQLIERADGLREDAYLHRAILYREKEDWTVEAQAIDLEALMAGRVADVALRANDLLYVASVSELQEDYTVTIFGSVAEPATYPYAENMSVEDLIIASGGLLESASTANVTIARRIKSPKSLNVSDTLFDVFTIEINDKLKVDGQSFKLMPFDQVYVRRSPVYVTQSSVTVQGEVAFEGDYPLTHRNMRLSEAIAAAGGTNPDAFIEGAYLLRRMTDEEQQQSNALRQMIDKQAKTERDTLTMAGLDMSNIYTVGIDLAAAINTPGSDADVVLRDGDVVSIPQYNGTVRVMGAVMYPNSVTFQEGKSVKYYVKSAGGYDNRARKNRAYVIYMNGMVDSGRSAKVRPGSIVIIPTKELREPFNLGDLVQSISATASMAAVVISAIHLAK